MNNTPKTRLSPRLPETTKIALGSLTVSPMQANLPTEEAAAVIAYAFDSGINMVDTAQYYDNYDLLYAGLKKCRNPENVVVSTKTYAYNKKLAEEAVEEARRKLDRDVIDIFMLHEQESYDTLRGHMEALEYLLECREKGIVRAVGASTHHVALVRGIIRLADEGIRLDVCHPLYNKYGIGIADGGEDDMARALTELHSRGIGVYAMKVFGGGHLAGKSEEALAHVLSRPFVDAAAIGMQSVEEIDANLRFLEHGAFSDEDRVNLGKKHRTLHVEEYCEGCGRCVERCGSGALRLVKLDKNNDEVDIAGNTEAEFPQAVHEYRAEPDDSKCVRCGYCTKVCPVFALKIY